MYKKLNNKFILHDTLNRGKDNTLNKGKNIHRKIVVQNLILKNWSSTQIIFYL